MKNEIMPIPECFADTRRLTEIKFDCLVTIHDSGNRVTNGTIMYEQKTLPPQWFRAQTHLTLDMIKYCDEYSIGSAIKQLYNELERTINKYENS